MTPESPDVGKITELLKALPSRGEAAAGELMPLVYAELRRLAHAMFRREKGGITLQPTALVHEAYLKLVDHDRIDWAGRTHFFAVGAQVMRRLLVDEARRRNREKRGGDLERIELTEAEGSTPISLSPEELLSLDTALDRLAAVDPRGARVVELRFFAGLGAKEVAELLGVSLRTVEGDWTHARAWLRRELSGAPKK